MAAATYSEFYSVAAQVIPSLFIAMAVEVRALQAPRHTRLWQLLLGIGAAIRIGRRIWRRLLTALGLVFFATVAVAETVALLELRRTSERPWHHYLVWAGLALMAVSTGGLLALLVLEALRRPHNLEVVARHRGILFVNHSRATTPRGTDRALEKYRRRRGVRVILGGARGDGAAQRLADVCAKRITKAYVIGDGATEICDRLAALSVKFAMCDDLADALQTAYRHAKTGEVIVLAPGCASSKPFNSFEERGDMFRRLVHEEYGD
jgi:UDP-N-acetylmuramoylalanine-D-glutamate ligase